MNNLLITGAGSKFTKLIIKKIYKNYDKILNEAIDFSKY